MSFQILEQFINTCIAFAGSILQHLVTFSKSSNGRLVWNFHKFN